MSEQVYLKTDETAVRLGLNPGTLRHQRIRGSGPPFVKFGRSVRYRLADLDAYMAVRVVSSTSEGRS